MKFSLVPVLCACLLLPACESVRTVYDEGGNVVTQDEGGDGAEEMDLFTAYEKRFDESFSEKRNAQGVPEAKSRRVSSFQKELDSARDTDNPYRTKSFGDVKESNLRDQSFGGRKVYGGRREFEDGERTRSSISRDARPDFMNESHGIAHSDYESGSRVSYGVEGRYTDDSEHSYSTNASRYKREQESGYFESHRHDTPAPPIYDHRTQQTREIMNVRNILGRDKTDAEE